jgi:hypothetical protein
MARRVLCVAGFLTLALGVLAGEPAQEDAGKRMMFNKLYGSKDVQDQLKAVELLDDVTQSATTEMLLTVARGNPAKEVRFAAFKKLCAVPARDPRLAGTLAELFKAVKPTESEAKVQYAQEMGKAEFKYPAYEAMVDYGSKLRYPELVSGYRPEGNRGGGGTGILNFDPNTVLRRQRAEFESFVEAFNAITGAGLKPKDKSSPREFLTWWNANRDKIATADRELARKYAAEATAAREKMENPLLPKKAEKAEKKE